MTEVTFSGNTLGDKRLWEAGLEAGKKRERERIRQNILTRVTDLNYCTKRDNCSEFARLIESYIEEWLDGEE